jgi:hypothetical protein
MTTPTDKDLRALALKATDGPWEWEAPMYPGQECYVRGPGRCIAEVDCGDIEQIADDNAAFIAAANPQTVIGLLDRIEAAEAKAERLEQQAAQWKDEDRGHKASLHECYRAVTGGTGEPADWHGSRPVVECIEATRSQLEEAREILDFYGTKANHHDVPFGENQWKASPVCFDGGRRARNFLRRAKAGGTDAE